MKRMNLSKWTMALLCVCFVFFISCDKDNFDTKQKKEVNKQENKDNKEKEEKQKQEENKPFISGTIRHIGNDGKETRLGNITIHLKE